jgi:LPXTG-motif cell wall-anchored protein
VRWWARGAAVVLASVAAAVGGSAAQAADELELSTDGLTWTSTLPDSIFGDPRVLVPGDVVAGRLWLRNASGDRARVDLRVAPGLGDGSASLGGALELTIDGARVGGGSRWSGPALAPGGVARVELRVALPADADNGTRASTVRVIDAAVLVQTAVGSGEPSPSVPPATAGPTARPAPSPTTHPTAGASPTAHPGAPAPGPGAAPDGGLAHTGADASVAFWLGLSAVVAGAVLLAARRRARRDQEE